MADATNGGWGSSSGRAGTGRRPSRTDDPRERPIGELVKDLAGQTSTLVRKEIELARPSCSRRARSRARAPACWPAPPSRACSRSAR